jgi:hypothetical protein
VGHQFASQPATIGCKLRHDVLPLVADTEGS